ncbi:MAG: hypothetical protein LUE08_08560 [Akkermansiaceae bacterium]|nr:hypothetical protein [Akkermansiaceae bacterium]
MNNTTQKQQKFEEPGGATISVTPLDKREKLLWWDDRHVKIIGNNFRYETTYEEWMKELEKYLKKSEHEKSKNAIWRALFLCWEWFYRVIVILTGAAIFLGFLVVCSSH